MPEVIACTRRICAVWLDRLPESLFRLKSRAQVSGREQPLHLAYRQRRERVWRYRRAQPDSERADRQG